MPAGGGEGEGRGAGGACVGFVLGGRCEAKDAAGRDGLARDVREPNWYKPGFVGEKYVGPVVLLSGACKAQ